MVEALQHEPNQHASWRSLTLSPSVTPWLGCCRTRSAAGLAVARASPPSTSPPVSVQRCGAPAHSGPAEHPPAVLPPSPCSSGLATSTWSQLKPKANLTSPACCCAPASLCREAQPPACEAARQDQLWRGQQPDRAEPGPRGKCKLSVPSAQLARPMPLPQLAVRAAPGCLECGCTITHRAQAGSRWQLLCHTVRPHLIANAAGALPGLLATFAHPLSGHALARCCATWPASTARPPLPLIVSGNLCRSRSSGLLWSTTTRPCPCAATPSTASTG